VATRLVFGSIPLVLTAARVLVVGCGGNGSAIAAGLPYLHQALLAYGHPEGLHVTLLDPDVISPTNCVRQPFSQSEIGLYKSVVLANRLNLFWGLDWEGIPEGLDPKRRLEGVDIVIGCVDTRKARAAIANCAENWSEVDYWLDLGNNADSGQFVLGEPLNRRNRRHRLRLRTVSELFPEATQAELDGDGLPSCSAAEALDRQEPFVNPTLANHALALLARLFRYGTICYHGAFVGLSSLAAVQALLIRDTGDDCKRQPVTVKRNEMLPLWDELPREPIAYLRNSERICTTICNSIKPRTTSSKRVINTPPDPESRSSFIGFHCRDLAFIPSDRSSLRAAPTFPKKIMRWTRHGRTIVNHSMQNRPQRGQVRGRALRRLRRRRSD
jgi:PRTRC genetic system ThiF family protein